MAVAMSRVRAALMLHRAVPQPQQCLLASLQLARTLVCKAVETPPAAETPPEAEKNTENKLLLDNLKVLGVDVPMARKRQPGVLRRTETNEHGLVTFLKAKGADRETVASIISRFPRAITRSRQHLEERWQLWRSVFQSDQEVVSILHRSPESFFRSSDNDNLEKNIVFLSSLGLDSRDLHRLLTTAPRTFSNSVELNRQMVELLQDICHTLGGTQPSKFAKAVISKNLYILIRSTKRVEANVKFFREALGLRDSLLLAFLQGSGADILDMSHDILRRNFRMLQEKLTSVGGSKKDSITIIVNYASVLYLSPERLSEKVDCLLREGISVGQIVQKPKVLDFSLENLKWRMDELRKLHYDFGINGITVLDTSKKRFEAKLIKLSALE
ncbi:transcription termination factor 1, mitochondrial [Engraulis encrasicolus]|uniref:transcription termination factor 1, mitochondrial n=1 Tax=Engraulis encrasicolus TaxID=184585 RepID=UPI002FD3A12F